jgi:peptidoglycan hydrolase CwlO-like protein
MQTKLDDKDSEIRRRYQVEQDLQTNIRSVKLKVKKLTEDNEKSKNRIYELEEG